MARKSSDPRRRVEITADMRSALSGMRASLTFDPAVVALQVTRRIGPRTRAISLTPGEERALREIVAKHVTPHLDSVRMAPEDMRLAAAVYDLAGLPLPAQLTAARANRPRRSW